MASTTPRPPDPTRSARWLRPAALVGILALTLAGCVVDTPESADAPAEPGEAPLVVDTTTGTYRGSADGAVHQFLGMRYAEPPTGERRWALPVEAPDTPDEVEATRAGAACPQAGSLALTATSSDEDCLFVNVTTPATESEEPRPVMVWWHGGGFTSGSGDQYDAQRLADEGDVVVVTANYRLGMLGYLGLPGLEGSGNFGLADQLAALRWASANAEAFGGDPDDVTLFGESAGATSACAALTSPGVGDLVDQAVLVSGSCRLEWPKGTLFPGLPQSRSLIPLSDSEQLGTGVAATLGCKGSDTLACLRRQPVDALLAQTAAFGNPLAYDTDLLPQDPVDAIAAGDVADVRVLAGGNLAEHRSFIGGLLLTDPDAVTSDNYPTLVGASFDDDAAAVLDHYPLADFESAAVAWSTLVTDVAWACNTTRGNRELAAAGLDVWSYEFADETSPDVSGVAKSGVPQGAAHATDLPYYFDLGGRDLLTGRGQADLGRTMVQMLTTFAHDGAPSSSRFAPWPETTADEAPVMQLGYPDVQLVDHREEHQCGFWEEVAPS